MKKLTLVLPVLLFALSSSAAPFQNLDFEQANTNNLQAVFTYPSGNIGYVGLLNPNKQGDSGCRVVGMAALSTGRKHRSDFPILGWNFGRLVYGRN